MKSRSQINHVDEQGQTMVEYSTVLAVITLTIAVVIAALSGALGKVLGQVGAVLK